MGKEEGLGGGAGELWGRRDVGRRVTGEEGDGSVPSSHSTLHDSHHPANTDFNSSLASGTMVFFPQKSVMKPPSSLLAVQLPCSVLLHWTARWGWDRGPRKETLQKALDPRCWVYRAKWGGGEKGS